MNATIVVWALFATSVADAGTIEGTEYPLYTRIDNQFATSQGGLFIPFVTFGVDGGVTGIYGTDPSGYARFWAPIEVTFVLPADGTTPAVVNGTVSAIWGDGGGDVDYLRLRAYDASGSLLGTVNSSGTTWQSISFTGSGIRRAIFDQQPGAPSSSDTFLDSLTFPTPIPEPATLLIVAAAGLPMLLKRRRNA